MCKTVRGNRVGFTLIELLIVLGILMAMIAILLPKILTGNSKKDATAVMKQESDIASGLIQFKGDIGHYPPSLQHLWTQQASDEPYWKGPYMDTPMLTNGTSPNENVQDQTVSGVTYSYLYVTSASGGSGSCATSTAITGNTGDTGASVVMATAVPHDIAVMIKSEEGNKVCDATPSSTTTTTLYFPFDEVWN